MLTRAHISSHVHLPSLQFTRCYGSLTPQQKKNQEMSLDIGISCAIDGPVYTTLILQYVMIPSSQSDASQLVQDPRETAHLRVRAIEIHS